ncbi:hypothetical protein D1007_56093 [Hordeum vulgare]|uniref:Predicted protein n=1 Tax=Hordeum vulgare subsp. vulgare TaxID=112509 RepID=F2EG01_HORVV|nr:hypothetical protein D1007_56093 [Hordeum vulgare]BAK06273.1 predicted protein [Hordeum vulgare subsp. vulgare]
MPPNLHLIPQSPLSPPLPSLPRPTTTPRRPSSLAALAHLTSTRAKSSPVAPIFLAMARSPTMIGPPRPRPAPTWRGVRAILAAPCRGDWIKQQRLPAQDPP